MAQICGALTRSAIVLSHLSHPLTDHYSIVLQFLVISLVFVRMPSVPLYTKSSHEADKRGATPLPSLLSTPSGLVIVEIQGTIHAPFPSISDDASASPPTQTPVGRLDFPDYDSTAPDDNKWMKRVYLYVGQHQRLVGEVKKLPKAVAVLQKREPGEDAEESRSGQDENVDQDVLEIAAVVKYKVLFQSRPEPV